MEWAALITWILTAGGGFLMLAIWLRNGGMEQSSPAPAGANPLVRPPLILGHFGLAATGLVLWIIYVASDSDALAWIAFVLLLVVALLGFTMLAIWLRQRNTPAQADPTAPATAPASKPAEQRFPVAVVGAHGVLAATTLVLVFLAAIGVGS
ncbi:MAG TPA: hypothetical protein VFL77_06575 [Solirubrobacterales bacterium]|nr:hypothetical protein [Solirubrobacterales bacterium]